MPKKPEEKVYQLTSTSAEVLASLRPQAMIVDWGSREWRVPALPAIRWLEILLAPEIDFEAVFPGLCGEDVVLEVNWMILSGVSEELDEVIRECIEVASGRRWWITLRLVGIIRANWDGIGPHMYLVDLERVSLAQWLDVAYGALIERLSQDPQRAAEFTARLVAPPASERQPVDDEVEGNAFIAAMRLAR